MTLDLPGATYTVVAPSGSGSSVIPDTDLSANLVTVGDTGSAILLTTRTVDYLEPFWLGVGSALLFFLFGYSKRLLAKTTGGGD